MTKSDIFYNTSITPSDIERARQRYLNENHETPYAFVVDFDDIEGWTCGFVTIGEPKNPGYHFAFRNDAIDLFFRCKLTSFQMSDIRDAFTEQ